MRKSILGLSVVALALSATTATKATEWMFCGDSEAVVEIGFLLGTVDAFMPSAITMRHDTNHWASDAVYGEGAPIVMGQGFADATTLRVDLYDDGLSARIAELRLSRAEEGTDVVMAGTLRIPGAGVWAVACDAT
jgi:hypothetical protein